MGVADASASGGHFGRNYTIASLPQSLRLEPGSANAAFAWVRGDRGGVPAAVASAQVGFHDDVTLDLDACVRGPATAPHSVGAPAGPGDARLVASQGQGGALVVAIAAGEAAVIDAQAGGLVATAAPAPPSGTPVAAIALDVDGDCDDDVIVATDGAPPQLWRRDGATFTVVGSIGSTAASALAAADVDGDGDVDLIVGSGGTLTLYRNDGGGTFVADLPALASGGNVSAISALAMGDLDGDGHPDLVVGQAGGPLAAWLGDPAGSGSFAFAPAVVPPVSLDVVRLALVDADANFAPDLVVAVRGLPMRLYIDRDGRLEDQSFTRLPAAPVADAIAIGGWDAGCEPDAVIASSTGGVTLQGQPGGVLMTEATAPAATDVVMVDVDDDGELDAILAGPDGVTWLAR